MYSLVDNAVAMGTASPNLVTLLHVPHYYPQRKADASVIR